MSFPPPLPNPLQNLQFGQPVNTTITNTTPAVTTSITHFNTLGPLFVPVNGNNVTFTGSTGSTGPQGFQGPVGTAANTGSTGPGGVTGPQGFQGVPGSSTNTGSTGHSGHSGATGPTGPQGVPGTATATGATGTTGITGPQGVQGAIGVATNTGATGPRGTGGNTGPQGVPGTPGPIGGMPTGTVVPYAGGVTPSGWLLCQGQSLSTITYPALFNAIGYVYGGSGSNFTVPDLRTRAPRGVGTGFVLGAIGGADTVGITANNLPVHTHSLTDPGHTHDVNDGGHAHQFEQGGGGAQASGTFWNGVHNTYQSAMTAMAQCGLTIAARTTGIVSGNNTTTATALVVSNPYIVMNMIIKT